MRCALLTAVTAVLLVAPVLGVVQAKGQDTVTIGTRVRVLAPGIAEGSIVGVVLSTDGDDLLVRREGNTGSITLPRAAISRLEVSRGKRSKAKGALIGGVIGAGAGAAIGAASWGCNGDVGCELARDLVFESKGGYVAGYSALGAGVGALAGVLLTRGEKWQIVTTRRVALRFLITGDRALGIGLVIAF